MDTGTTISHFDIANESKFVSMGQSKENSLKNGHLYPYRENYAFSSLSFRRTSEKFGFREKMLYLLALNSPQYGTSTTLLGNLTVKNFFIITKINLLFCSLKPVLSTTYPSKNSLFTFLIAPFRYCNAAIKIFPRLHNPSVSTVVLGEVLQSSDNSSLDLFYYGLPHFPFVPAF